MAPDEVKDAFALGLRALAHERIDLAIEQLSLAIAGSPNDPAIYAFLASALFAAARPAEAADAIAHALELGPDDFWPNQKAAELRLRLGDPAAAIDHFLAALRSAEPGSRDAKAAQLGLVRARREAAGAISHRAILPHFGWLAGRRRRTDVARTPER